MYFTTSAPNFLWGACFQFFTKNRPQKHQKRAILHTSQTNGELEPPPPPLATLLQLLGGHVYPYRRSWIRNTKNCTNVLPPRRGGAVPSPMGMGRNGRTDLPRGSTERSPPLSRTQARRQRGGRGGNAPLIFVFAPRFISCPHHGIFLGGRSCFFWPEKR